MTREYQMLHDTFGWSDAEFEAINRTAAEAAFCDAATRTDILKKLETSDV